MNKIALFTLGWFVGSGIGAHIIITAKIIELIINKKRKNKGNKGE